MHHITPRYTMWKRKIKPWDNFSYYAIPHHGIVWLFRTESAFHTELNSVWVDWTSLTPYDRNPAVTWYFSRNSPSQYPNGNFTMYHFLRMVILIQSTTSYRNRLRVMILFWKNFQNINHVIQWFKGQSKDAEEHMMYITSFSKKILTFVLG